MSKGLIISGVMAATVVAVGAWGVLTYVSFANQGNRMEIALKTKHENLGNVLSSGYQQISGVVQVTEMAKDDLKEVFTAAITAREGEDGSKAIFKMVTESNPNVDASLYREVQRVVQATKKEYQSEQTAFLMQKANYKEALGTVWGGWWLKTAGYPKVDPDSYKIVVTSKASTALQTGVEEEIVLRPKK